MPAHASSLCVGYPQLCANASNGRDGHCGLNPANNSTFEFVDGLVGELTASSKSDNGSEIAALFPENFFHFGGDEVDTRCWGPPAGENVNITGTYPIDPQIWAWLKATGNLSAISFRDMNGYGGKHYQYYLSEALGYFYQRLDEIAFAHGKTPVQSVHTQSSQRNLI